MRTSERLGVRLLASECVSECARSPPSPQVLTVERRQDGQTLSVAQDGGQFGQVTVRALEAQQLFDPYTGESNGVGFAGGVCVADPRDTTECLSGTL